MTEIRLSSLFHRLKCAEWQVHFSDNSVNFHCRFSRLSITIQLFSFYEIKILLYVINYAEKNNQTVFKHNVILKFAVLTLLALVYLVNLSKKMFQGSAARLSSVLIARTKDMSNCNTLLSLTCALFTLIPLWNCCDFHVYWKDFPCYENNRRPSKCTELSRLYTYCRYNRRDNPHSCCSVFRID